MKEIVVPFGFDFSFDFLYQINCCVIFIQLGAGSILKKRELRDLCL